MNDNPTCPYCNKLTDGFNETFLFKDRSFICRKHNNITVLIKCYTYKVDFISEITLIKDKPYSNSIIICPYSSTMVLRLYSEDKMIIKLINLPFDKHLTPENFELKLKTYLVFS